MRALYYNAIPYAAEEVTLALETGANGLIVPADKVAAASSLARCEVFSADDAVFVSLGSAADEQAALSAMARARLVVLNKGWEIIPVENLLAHAQQHSLPATLALEVTDPEQARLASGILEKGVKAVVVSPSSLDRVGSVAASLVAGEETLALREAVVTAITPVGMGHRVCVDTLSRMKAGQGMLVGNSAAFTFLVNAETQHNEYVAPRPFRVNAGAVHAYAVMPGDKTKYLEELRAGDEVLLADAQGETELAVVGRVKVERRPMLLVKAAMLQEDGSIACEGSVFLQNAETICLVSASGAPVSVVALRPKDRILCRQDTAGRHFGIRIAETIEE